MPTPSDPIREDLRDLKNDFREGMGALQAALQGLGDKLTAHALEDADREGKVTAELGLVRSKLEALSADSDDRQKFMRGWVSGLVAVALAAAMGFLFRTAIDQAVARPSTPTMQAK